MPLRIALFLLFTVSGFSGLIYESIWSHYLKLLLGHAAYAQTLVLAIYMGGMSLGAWLAARYSERIKNPLLFYAGAELIIGLFAFGFHSVFVGSTDFLYQSLLPAVDSAFLITTIKWGLATSLIVVQAILLGTTFPFMSTAVIRTDQSKSGHSLGMLYFTNSGGAAIGVLVSGLYLIPNSGLPSTIATAGLINCALAVIVFAIAMMVALPEIKADTQSERKPITRFGIIIMLAAGLTGFASFLYEIGWIRMLSLVLGSTTQSFEIMLAAFIAGLAFGGLWIRNRIDQLKDPVRFIGIVQILMAICALATVPLYESTFDLMQIVLNSLTTTDNAYRLYLIISMSICLLVMLPATFFAGMTLPLLSNILLKHDNSERAIGHIYASNTIGAIVGIMVAIHILMPLLGVKWLIGIGALVDLGLGIYLIQYSLRSKAKFYVLSAGASAILLSVVLVTFISYSKEKMASGVYRTGITSLTKNSTFPFYKDGKTASISLQAIPDGSASIRTNGKPDALLMLDPNKPVSSDESTMILAGLIPLAIHPNAKQIANIGFGSGLTAHALLGASSIERVDTVEIEKAMVEAARHFGAATERVYTDPRSHIHLDDAKTFFSTNKKKYDIIVSEPSNPWVSGVASLFTAEFYKHIQLYLKEDGLFVQWLQLYETNIGIMSSVFKSLGQEFENYAVYHANDSDILIIATKKRNLYNLNPWIFKAPKLAAILKRIHIHNIDDLELRYFANKSTLQPFFNKSLERGNSDYFPVIGYKAPKALFQRTNANSISEIATKAPLPVLEILQQQTVKDIRNFDAYYAKSNLAASVHKTVAFLNGTAEQAPEYKANYALSFIQLKYFIRNCRSAVPDHTFEQNLILFAGTTLRFLSKETTLNMLALFDNCGEKIPAGAKRWLQLFRAVAERNGDDMLATADDIMNTQRNPLSKEQLAYLEASIIVAALLNNSKIYASHVLKKLPKAFIARKNMPLYATLLRIHYLKIHAN